MKVNVRLTTKLFESIRADLRRPHAFAAERVGFVFGKLGNRFHEQRVVLLSDYEPIADEHYIETYEAGARIGCDAIRFAMQSILNSNSGAFHVHLHSHRGKPVFSSIDRRSIPKVVAGLQTAQPEQAHGMFLLSQDNAVADVWMPGQSFPIEAAKVSVVGHPLQSFY